MWIKIFFPRDPAEKKISEKGLPFSKQSAYVSRVTHDDTPWPDTFFLASGARASCVATALASASHLKPAAKSVATCTAAALSRSDRSLS